MRTNVIAKQHYLTFHIMKTWKRGIEWILKHKIVDSEKLFGTGLGDFL